jgi:hypothetical protein
VEQRKDNLKDKIKIEKIKKQALKQTFCNFIIRAILKN